MAEPVLAEVAAAYHHAVGFPSYNSAADVAPHSVRDPDLCELCDAWNGIPDGGASFLACGSRPRNLCRQLVGPGRAWELDVITQFLNVLADGLSRDLADSTEALFMFWCKQGDGFAACFGLLAEYVRQPKYQIFAACKPLAAEPRLSRDWEQHLPLIVEIQNCTSRIRQEFTVIDMRTSDEWAENLLNKDADGVWMVDRCVYELVPDRGLLAMRILSRVAQEQFELYRPGRSKPSPADRRQHFQRTGFAYGGRVVSAPSRGPRGDDEFSMPDLPQGSPEQLGRLRASKAKAKAASKTRQKQRVHQHSDDASASYPVEPEEPNFEFADEVGCESQEVDPEPVQILASDLAAASLFDDRGNEELDAVLTDSAGDRRPLFI